MAEARTDEEEEGGLETSEEPVVRRQPRPGAGGGKLTHSGRLLVLNRSPSCFPESPSN